MLKMANNDCQVLINRDKMIPLWQNTGHDVKDNLSQSEARRHNAHHLNFNPETRFSHRRSTAARGTDESSVNTGDSVVTSFRRRGTSDSEAKMGSGEENSTMKYEGRRRRLHHHTSRRGVNRRGNWRRRWRPYRHQMDNNRREMFRRRWPEGNNQDNWSTTSEQWTESKECKTPVAPCNTNEFLIDDHNVREPDFDQISKLIHYHDHHHHNEDKVQRQDQGGALKGIRRRCNSESTPTRAALRRDEEVDDDDEGATSSDEFYSSPDDEQDFILRQFSETYENSHAERLHSMSKTELVQDYLLLEKRIEELQNKLSKERVSHQSSVASTRSDESELISAVMKEEKNEEQVNRMEQLQKEMKRLKNENERLSLSNQQMKCLMSEREVKTDEESKESEQESKVDESVEQMEQEKMITDDDSGNNLLHLHDNEGNNT